MKEIVDQGDFYRAFWAMSAVCVICYIVLLICSVNLVLLRLGWSRPFIAVVLFEVVYFTGVAALSLHPVIGRSVAAATGVANGGLTVQLMILFPFWAPLILLWAQWRLRTFENRNSA
jgi:hypothetical protein